MLFRSTGGTVVVLGKTGRNFAAGMSGGRAFILDLDSELVNSELVDISAVPDNQKENLKSIISRFYSETGSDVAHSLLAKWEENIHRISMVMPRDFARVLKVIEVAEREGRSPESAIMEVLNG